MDVNEDYKSSVLRLLSTTTSDLKSLMSYDFRLSLFASSLNSYRCDSILKPFPNHYISEDNEKQFDLVKRDLNSIPSLVELQSGYQMSDNCWRLLHWVMTCGQFKLVVRSVNSPDLPQELTTLMNANQLALKFKPSLVFEVISQPKRSFVESRQRYGTFCAFHGSSTENFHSILNNGLINCLNKRDLYGSGTYITSRISVAIQFCPFVFGWNKSSLGKELSCLAVCQVIKHPDLMSQSSNGVPNDYYVIQNDDLLHVSHVLVYCKNRIKNNLHQNVITSMISKHTSTVLSSSNSNPTPKNTGSSSGTSNCTPYRNNEVRSVLLYGVPIIALVMDSQERLCLAQISNTLLKNFSYNEIHNRRVALGITCVQCTPVQLELLRRAGAMPVSSRRCGMITKREAERLCKSFLAETAPPKLPDTFAFDIYHQCAWGCRGEFTPSRYNSSRAKCIKCVYCGLFFSPNKFIFHSHRLPDSKYIQPDAANFNSWRRHIKLILSPEPPDEVAFAWEDVKAMFNGGSRKRAMAAGLSCSSSRNVNSSQDYLKRQTISSSSPESNHSLTPNTTMSDSLSPKSTTNVGPTYFPLISLPNKSYSMPSTAQFNANPSIQSPPIKSLSTSNSTDFRQSFAEFMWIGSGKSPALHIPYSCLLWPRPPTGALEFGAHEVSRNKLFGGNDTNSFMFSQQHRDHLWSQESLHESRDTNNNTTASQASHSSAFKPVVSKNIIGNVSPVGRHIDGVVKSPDTNNFSPQPSQSNSDPDVDIVGEDCDDSQQMMSQKEENHVINCDINDRQNIVVNRKSKSYHISDNEVNGSDRKRTKLEATVSRHEDMTLNFLGHLSEGTICDDRSGKSMAIDLCNNTALDLRNMTSLSRDDLHQILLKQSEDKHKSEREYDVMRETLEQQVRKELIYREEMAKQLHLVRESLCQELEPQDWRSRLSVHHKLQ
ncbi:SKI family transcriptional corepressor 1 homolog-B-like [Oppia nitens]|uniref:SKI family transcriptional corepressor 1 homolog-B-like n=1 Tax=Oppia nitens TaxID=1686743 RepID=UPI0023DB27ED|nr:SKI family transcriptional corepressor 1 homolog-B-like [Oppia nitens]